MLHPSYSELIDIINGHSENGEEPVIQSRYSVVTAAAKRARQLIHEEEMMDPKPEGVSKPLSEAVEELKNGTVRIMSDEDFEKAKEEMESLGDTELGFFDDDEENEDEETENNADHSDDNNEQ